MKTKMTFFNSRKERLFHDYHDTNNLLFKIIYLHDNQLIEKNYIFRNLKKDNKIEKYIYKKINETQNIVEFETDHLSKTEYDLCKLCGVPNIIQCINSINTLKKTMTN